MTEGYRALRFGAGLVDITARTRIRATGDDRQRLLHALATNRIEGLQPGQGVETFFLSPQGRIQAHCRVYIFSDSVLIETSAERGRTMLDYLDHYIIMDDVSLDDRTGETAAFTLEGPSADDIALRALSLFPPGDADSHASAGDLDVFRSTLTGSPGLWICAPRDRGDRVRQALLDAGALEASADDLRTVRVENRRPEFDADYFDSNIPHETQQLSIVSFTKGCYTGQEIVERVRSQGRVNRLLTPIEIDADALPSNAEILHGEKAVGQATSLVLSPQSGKVLGFAILRREATEPGVELSAGGSPARALAWPE